MGNVILIETCILGFLLLMIFAVMVSREKIMENRSWWLGVMIVAVLLYVIAVSITASINAQMKFF